MNPRDAAMMSERQCVPETPERAVLDAFDAFRHRDVDRFARMATNASLHAVATQMERDLDDVDSEARARTTQEMTDSRAESILARVMARLPHHLTDMLTCLIVGRVLEARIFDASPDGRGMIRLECRVAGAGNDWLGVDSPWPIDRAILSGTHGVAHVVFHPVFELPGKGLAPIPPERQTATTQLADGEWKLVLDEHSALGLPGFRGMGFWVDPA